MAHFFATLPIEHEAPEDEQARIVTIDMRESTETVPDEDEELNDEVLDDEQDEEEDEEEDTDQVHE